MAITYERVSDEVHRLIERVITDYHVELYSAGVRIDALMAQSIDKETGAEKSQALKLRGYPCMAKIQVTSYQDRARGIADAKLVIDDYSWMRLTDSQRVALIDHELEHLELQCDNIGLVKLDDLGRPKLKIRPHNFELGWFTAVAQRHGEAAIEVREVQRFQEEYGQYCLFPTQTTEPVTATVTITDGHGKQATTDIETLSRVAEKMARRRGPHRTAEDERDPAL